MMKLNHIYYYFSDYDHVHNMMLKQAYWFTDCIYGQTWQLYTDDLLLEP